MLAQAVPLEVVSEVLGHASIRMTKDVYGHLIGNQKRDAADAMGIALWGGQSGAFSVAWSMGWLWGVLATFAASIGLPS